MRTHIDLFSGIGGFALAAQWCGLQTVAFSEVEPYACKVLKRHWPNVPNLGDITRFSEWPEYKPWLITGGFPCQPFSCAGKRRGKEDHRHLWPSMLGVIERYRPAWVLGENVAGIVAMELDAVLSDLERLGYTTRPLVVPACAVDAKHRRERVWVVAHSEHRRIQIGRRTQTAGRSSKDTCGVSGNESPRVQQQAGTILVVADQQGSQGHGGLRECAGECVAGPCSWPDEGEWFAESGMGRISHGVPNRTHRLRGLGNAIVPQVAYEILKAMIYADENMHKM